MSLVTAVAILMIGFSICSSVLLTITHFNQTHYQELRFSRCMGLIMLAGLCGLQVAHFFFLYANQHWISTSSYNILLFIIAPSFYLFSQPILIKNKQQKPKLVYFAHLIPIAISPFLASQLALPLAFLLGAIYLVWLAISLFQLRREHDNFKQEIILLGGVFVIAITVAIFGLLPDYLPGKLFFSFYSIAIGIAFFLVQIALGLRPDLSHEINETTSYATTTLSNIDCASVLSRLDKLMHVDKIYTDLSIGLNVGFSSQSAFYEAFREIEGMPPGQYRKLISASPNN